MCESCGFAQGRRHLLAQERGARALARGIGAERGEPRRRRRLALQHRRTRGHHLQGPLRAVTRWALCAPLRAGLFARRCALGLPLAPAPLSPPPSQRPRLMFSPANAGVNAGCGRRLAPGASGPRRPWRGTLRRFCRASPRTCRPWPRAKSLSGRKCQLSASRTAAGAPRRPDLTERPPTLAQRCPEVDFRTTHAESRRRAAQDPRAAAGRGAGQARTTRARRGRRA